MGNRIGIMLWLCASVVAELWLQLTEFPSVPFVRLCVRHLSHRVTNWPTGFCRVPRYSAVRSVHEKWPATSASFVLVSCSVYLMEINIACCDRRCPKTDHRRCRWGVKRTEPGTPLTVVTTMWLARPCQGKYSWNKIKSTHRAAATY